MILRRIAIVLLRWRRIAAIVSIGIVAISIIVGVVTVIAVRIARIIVRIAAKPDHRIGVDLAQQFPRLDYTNYHLSDAGGGAQPIIDGVRKFALEYLDASDRVGASADDARTVVITLSTDAAGEAADRSVTTYATRVRLRNR